VFTVMVAADSSPATGGFPLVGDGDADVVELLLDMLVSTSSLPAGSLEMGIVWGQRGRKEEEEEETRGGIELLVVGSMMDQTSFVAGDTEEIEATMLVLG